MTFMLSDSLIAKIASRTEEGISVPGYRNRKSDQHIIENAIRTALMEQAQMLISIVPASAVDTSGVLNLRK